LYNYSLEEEVVRSPVCQHVFHEECLLLWLNRKSSCPYCRQELFVKWTEQKQMPCIRRTQYCFKYHLFTALP
jgi:hypothetical protein